MSKRRIPPWRTRATLPSVPDNPLIGITERHTRANLIAGSRASLLFLTKERKSYQLKGRVEYLTSGPIFEGMKSWNPPRHPGVATALLRVEEIYSGAQRLV